MANQESLEHKPSSDAEVVMVPFPAQSHLNQLLQLSHIISSYNIKVHYVGSALHVSQVKSRASKYHKNPNSIEFHSLETPEFSSPPPSYSKYPSHLVPSFIASVRLREPVKFLLESLSRTTTRLVVIHDSLMSYVAGDAAGYLPNAEAYAFTPISAVSRFTFLRDSLDLKIWPEIPFSKSLIYHGLQEIIELNRGSMIANKKAGVIINTCRVLEGEFIDFIEEKEREKNADGKMWAIGPLETVTVFKKTPTVESKFSNFRHKSLEWLDEQKEKSVLYVSFGTTTFMDDDQIEELAKGLEESGITFLWVLRDADKGNIFEESGVRNPKLPLGFEEKTNRMGRGIIVRDWAPQMEILGHSSIGGFLSHCGWNSCLESLTLGVPLAAWPMHSDQPANAFLVTQVLKAGLLVEEWKIEEEIVSSSVIVEVLKRLMNSVEGEEVRRRAEELGCELRKCTEEGGVSRIELDSFIAHISRA